MKTIKDKFVAVFTFITEYVTIFATIIASTYIVVSSQFRPYSEHTLLLWLISLLGLIAISIANEKFFKLNRIERTTAQIKTLLSEDVANLDDFMFTRKNLSNFEERLSAAHRIFLAGGSLSRLSDEYYGFFEEKLKNGCKIEVIIISPFSNGANMLCKNVVYETKDEIEYSQRIVESLKRFLRLKKQYTNDMIIYLTENVPPFGIIAQNMGEKCSSIQIELYSYAVPTRDRINFSINKENKAIYAFFEQQIEMLRSTSAIYEVSALESFCSQYSVQDVS